MNKKSQTKVTKRKGSKTKTDSDAAEVFVLPPNLLEKLGINLRNIGSAPEGTKESQVTDINFVSKEKCASVSRNSPITNSLSNVSASAEIQSSIIETAELMTTSVFLSPTFISNNTNAIQGEIEIIGSSECEGLNKEGNINLMSMFNEHSNKKTEDMHKTDVTDSDMHKASITPIALSNQENVRCHKATIDNVETHDNELQTLIDDHADEAYSSDCSNSNQVRCSVQKDIKKSDQNKINIISEQIILPSQMYKFESGYSLQENNLVHVSIDTVIKSKKNNNIHHQNVLNMDVITNSNVNIDPTITTVNESKYMYDENCAAENIDISTLDSEIIQNIGETDAFIESNKTESDFVVTFNNQDNPRKVNEILHVSQKTDAMVKDKVLSDTGMTTSWHVETDNVNQFVNERGNDVAYGMNIESCIENNEDDGIETTKIVTTDLFEDRNEGVNESKSERAVDDITVITYDSNDENESRNVKNSALENVNTDAVIKEVTVDTGITIPWHTDSKIMNKKTKEPENRTNTELFNENNEGMEVGTCNVITTNSCIDGNEGVGFMLNVTSSASKSEMEDEDVAVMSDVSGVENVIIQMSQKTDAIIEGNVTVETDLLAPCHVDTDDVCNIGKEVGNETNTERYKEYNEDHEISTSKVITSDSCLNGNDIPKLNMISYEPVYEIQDDITVISYVDDVQYQKRSIENTSFENSLHTSTECMKSPVENNIQTDQLYPYLEMLPITQKLKTTELKTKEQFMEEENFYHKDIFSTNNKHTLSNDISFCEDTFRKTGSTVEIERNRSMNKDKNPRDTSHKKKQKLKQDQNTPSIHAVLETSTQSSVLEANIKQECERPESDASHCKQKEIYEFSEINKEKRKDNDNSYCESNNVILDDKVREIAQYLSKFADLKKRKSYKIMGSSKTFGNKKHSTYPKLSIHGVEKPGGSEIMKTQNTKIPPINTYERRRRQRCAAVPSYTFKEPETYSQSINFNDNSSYYDTCNEMEFCLCYDFGRLLYYENENSYEHIHFWNNTGTECTPDIIFSIYNECTPDVSMVNNVRIDEDECTAESYVIPIRKLCWNEIKFIDEYRLDDVHDLDVKRKETKEDYFNERDKTISSNGEDMANNCNASQGAENETTCKSKVTTVSRNSDITSNNKFVENERSEKTGKKRNFSVIPCDNDEPPAKKSGLIAKQLPQIKETRDYLNEHETAVTPVTNTSASIENNNVKGSSTPPQRMMTNSVAEQCALLNKARIVGQKQSFIPVEDAVNKSIEQTKTTPIISVVKPSETVAAMTISVEKPQTSVNVVTSNQSSDENKTIICGVCQQSVEGVDWIKHIAFQHNYLAWICGEAPLKVDNEAAVRDHLSHIAKSCGGLECVKCGLNRKHVKAYLSHIRRCSKSNESSPEVVPEVKSEGLCLKKEKPVDSELITCGVCEESMQNIDWNDHILARHNYLAWKIDEPSLDVNDEEVVREHLYAITKVNGGLTCAKCGLTRKYVKPYLSHIRSCSGLNESQNHSTNSINTSVVIQEKSTDINISENQAVPADTVLIKCGVCEEYLELKDWNDHSASRHDYLAWKFGDSPLDINNEDAVREHLHAISKTCGGLTCAKCGLTRKYVRAYLSHVKSCNGLSETLNDTSYNISTDFATASETVDLPNNSTTIPKEEEQNASINNTALVCGVCKETLQDGDWYSHIASQHDYMAWKHGEPTLDVNNEEAVRDHLYDITKACGGLTCSKCGLVRKYVKAYLSHFRNCEGPNEVSDCSASVNAPSELSAIVDQVTPPEAPALVKCGVCGQNIDSNEWTRHIATSHEYLAWRDGDSPFNVNDKQETRVHLQNLIKEIGCLSCPKCGLKRKYVKSYLQHLRICGDEQEDKNGDNHHKKTNDSQMEQSKALKCGVCSQIVESALWPKHLCEEHNYLAWKDGDTPPDLDDEDGVYQHLYNYAKEFGSLICKYCGISRKYVKPYLEHIKNCNQDVSHAETSVIDASNSTLEFDDSGVDFKSAGTCAVCHKEVEAENWIQHTQKEHNYLAWREGEKPWDVDDFADVNQYLYVISKKMGGLTCNKCGLVRKYVKTYLTHIKTCNVTDSNYNPTVCEGVEVVRNKEIYQCAMCKELIKAAHWKTHAKEKHYNVTWIVGETPIDIKNPYVVERYLKEYKQIYGNLQCRTCGATRASFSGFYAHIITCDKTEDEIDMYREVCEICNNKYLSIYKNQHAMIHKVQTYTAELKLKKEAAKKEDVLPLETSGKRRAAVKARSVIENYSNNMSKHVHSCKSCGFGTDFKEELQKHKCQVSNEKDFSGDESSAAEIGSSDEESPDSDVDSNISNEVNEDNEVDEEDDEPQQPKKKRYREPAPIHSKVKRIPFEVDDPVSFIKQGDIDFCDTHLSDDVLFSSWRRELETVPELDLPRYLPPLAQSCKLKSDSGWTTVDRFRAKKDMNGTSIFVGASIICIAWVPLRVEHINSGSANFLAIACHNAADCPRYQGDETLKHESMIQIWNFSEFKVLPEMSFGIAHDFGTVWSMDWCPSGARDPTPGDPEMPTTRLGLLAVACSSGSAYIFAVPYPPTVVDKDQLVHKLKPVAELRMTMGTDRKRYQATSVSWSKQKGHNIVLVGYADGSTAYYDLLTTSPLICTMENDVHVFYPYFDERVHNTCITGTDLYPAAGLGSGGGAGACASAAPTGAFLTARAGAGVGAGAGAGRARLQVAALGVAFAPHAAAAVLAGDDAIMHTTRSELVWVQPGRRLGAVRAAAGCARCARVAASTPPALRLMRPHPAYADPKKQVVGMLEMTHLAKKRKQVNDELAMTIEPLTYAEAIVQYGIKFQKVSKIDRASQQQYAAKPKSHFPERFPLADVKSMAFCPSRKYHDRLAVATHSGILFLMRLD